MAKKVNKKQKQRRMGYITLAIGAFCVVAGLLGETDFWHGACFGMGVIVLIVSYAAFTGRISDR